VNCVESQPLLGAYADRELDLVNALAVERHLKSCPRCGDAVRQVQAIHFALQDSQLSYAAPLSFRRRLIKETAAPAKREGARWTWRVPSLAFGGVCALALIFLGAQLVTLRSPGPGDEIVASHIRSLMADHLVDVVSSDSHTVKPWFAGKIDFTAPVRDFAAEGFPLIGGRIEYIHNRPVAALIYQRNRHTVNIFIWPSETSRDTSPSAATRRGFTITERENNGLHFTAISDLNREELDQLLLLVTN
jgi:anti-sigma factor RsiW